MINNVPLLRYIAQLYPGKILLWIYLIWYLTISTLYFDGDKKLWLTAFGISLIVGFALVLSTTCWPINIRVLRSLADIQVVSHPFSCFQLFITDTKIKVASCYFRQISKPTASLLA
jgi:hypothetical protein